MTSPTTSDRPVGQQQAPTNLKYTNDFSDLPALLTVDEFAELMRVGRKSAYSAIRRGEIPGVRRIGGTIRIARDAVVNWLLSGRGHGSR